MPWQVDHAFTELKKAANSRVIEIEASSAKIVVKGIVRTSPFPGTRGGRETTQRVWLEAQDLAHLPRCQLRTIGDNVGRHGCAALAIPLVNVLDDTLPLVAARYIEIQLPPFSPF